MDGYGHVRVQGMSYDVVRCLWMRCCFCVVVFSGLFGEQCHIVPPPHIIVLFMKGKCIAHGDRCPSCSRSSPPKVTGGFARRHCDKQHVEDSGSPLDDLFHSTGDGTCYEKMLTGVQAMSIPKSGLGQRE